MNRKGFSLVELLGVIVIIMVIVLMATSGYRLVSRKVKETTYDNKVSNIEIKAVEYASSTGKKTMNVDQLVKEGLITADDSEGNVINPVNGNSMNCHLVYITEESGNLYGNYTDQEECNTENLVVENLYLKINAYKANGANEMTNEIITEEWVRSNVVLVAEILNENINPANVTKIIWKTNVGREEREISGDYTSKNKYLVTAEQIVNSTYGVEIIMNDGTTYQAEKVVKIDKQRPIIYASETRIEKENDWTKEKEVTIKATDGNGSGIYGYSIGTSNDCVHASYVRYEDSVYKNKLSVEGTYYVCVRDKAGNVSEDVSTKSFTISKIDRTAPTCVWSGESTHWTADDQTINLSCSDDESGCTLQNPITKTYDSNIATEHWRYEISDYAGNVTVCEKDVSIYIDKNPPSCWNNGDLTLGQEEYNFTNNIGITWGFSGTGSVSCNPSNSLGTGSYNVSCSAMGNNGLNCNSSFNVRHNYSATLISQTCPRTCTMETNCHDRPNCHTVGYHWCEEGGGGCDTCNGSSSLCPDTECNGTYRDCDIVEYSCPYDCSYYTCPQGGNLIDDICYY